jgi:N-ethylmaleimide reductase
LVLCAFLGARKAAESLSGTIIAAGGFNQASAEEILQAGNADLVAFGRMFVANPDLPERMHHGYPLAKHDRDTLYGGDARGYLDYQPYAPA